MNIHCFMEGDNMQKITQFRKSLLLSSSSQKSLLSEKGGHVYLLNIYTFLQDYKASNFRRHYSSHTYLV
jgi:hypothetical protein